MKMVFVLYIYFFLMFIHIYMQQIIIVV